MSLALIQESAKEVRRLAIAGSPLAVGDFRLKKLIDPLEQAGAKVPVFAQVAKAISAVVDGKEADSAANLLTLSTLLNAILYTQGQSTNSGDFRELDMVATQCGSTRTTARVLKPLVQALTTSGGGRFEVIKSACERGAFNDLRLIEPAIKALDDSYPEVADLVAEKVLPGYGPGIVRRLKATFDVKGKKSDGRRLTIMHELDPAGALELCQAALDGGSPEVKAAAIACLGKHEECLPLVMEQVNSKNKTLRAAALEALAEHDRPEIAKIFTEMIQGKSLDLLSAPLQKFRNKQVLLSLVSEGRRVFDLLVKGDEEQIPRYGDMLGCLTNRKEPEVEEFLLSCFGQCDKLAKVKAAKNTYVAGADLVAMLAAMLEHLGSARALDAVLERRDAIPPSAFPHVLSCALRAWPADRVYQEFSPLLEQKRGAGKEKARQIETAIWSGFSNADDSEPGERKVAWDIRWLDAAIKADNELIVYSLATPNHKGAIAYLLKALESKKQQAGYIIQTLARCRHPGLTDVFIDLVQRKTKKAQAFDWEIRQLF
ncbi:MAG: HEAT repeat domain-containing protein, partial [Verrucomicrobiota bacterium]